MEDILNKLFFGEILHTTIHGNKYLFLKRCSDGGIKYSIKNNYKIIPFNTIKNAYNDFNKGVKINSIWYKKFNGKEYKSRPCNLSILNNLLNRF